MDTSLHLDDGVHLDGEAERQLVDADGGAGVAAGVAEDLDHQVRAAVDDARDGGEVGAGLDEAAELHDADDAVEVAVRAALIWASRLMPHRRAPALACSGVTSTPTVPFTPPEASFESWPERWSRLPVRT